MIQQIIASMISSYENMKPALEEKKLVFINTNSDDKASESYIKNKTKVCEKFNILTETLYVEKSFSKNDIVELIKKISLTDNIKGIVLQLPLRNDLKEFEQELLDSIPVDLDVDGLSTNNNIMPITSYIINKIIRKIPKWGYLNMLFIGKGKLTNGPVMKSLDDDGIDYDMIDSLSSEFEKMIKLFKSDLIISSTGVAGLLDNVEHKYIISPTISKDSDGNWSHDLSRDLMDRNDTHQVLNNIGKLTCLVLASRVLSNN